MIASLRFLFAAIALSFCTSAGLAAVVAEDDFETATTGNLDTQNTGTGWSSAWTATSAVETVIDTTATPLVFNVVGGGAINGGTRAVQFDADNTDAMARSIATQNGDVIYFRFLFRLDSGAVANNDFLAFWFEDGTGGAGHTAVPNIGVKGNRGDGSGTEDFYSRLSITNEVYSTNITQGQTYLIVGRLAKAVSGAANNWDSFALWVDPAFADSGSPDVTSNTGDNTNDFNSFGVRTANVDNGVEFTVDELVIGTVWNDVVSAPGTIVINKQTDPDGSPGSFTFSRSFGANFNLSDNGATAFPGLNAPGQYTVTESDPSGLGFGLTDIVCVDSDGGGVGSTVNIPARTATINLDPAETVTCTFTNTIADVDLTINKTCHAETSFTTCNLQVFNFGPATALNVVVDDPIPAGLSWSSDNCGAGPPVDDVLSWNVGTLNSGNGDVCEVVFDIAPGANNIKNTAFVLSDNGDTNPGNNSSETIAVRAVIPTLSAWGRWLLMATLAMAGLFGARRRLA